MLTSDQIRMARAALKIGVRELAGMAGVNPGTISRFETGKGGMQSGNLDAVQKALESAGVVFVDPNGLGPGVRLRERAT